MQLPIEAIKTDAEFKAACVASGIEVIRILDFIKENYKNQVFSENLKDNEVTILRKKVNNMDEVITTIANAQTTNTPIFNI